MAANREVIALKKDGSTLPVEVNLSPNSTEEGDLVIASIRDVSQRREVEAELRSAKQESDIANATKTRFLAAAIHELLLS